MLGCFARDSSSRTMRASRCDTATKRIHFRWKACRSLRESRKFGREDDSIVRASGGTHEAEFELRLPTVVDPSEEREWLAKVLQFHLDEEWMPLEIHRDIGIAASNVYMEQRSDGVDDLGSIVLAIGTQLTSFDFADSFVDSFEVANKASEFLMMKMGREVCCQSEEDRDALSRYEEIWKMEEKN